MLVGFHVEGHDHLILKAILSRILGLEESEIQPDIVGRTRGRGRGWVLRLAEKSLRRFYGKCAQFAVLGVDNDGNVDVDKEGIGEDPKHPRHYLHENGRVDGCAECELIALVEKLRPELNWLPKKPGASWPVIIAVPVEEIEAWLLAMQAIINPGSGDLRSENTGRSVLKKRFYNSPAATEDLVEAKALPMIRSMTDENFKLLREYSRSFEDFLSQVYTVKERMLAHGDCW